jgi:hypothetical protein
MLMTRTVQSQGQISSQRAGVAVSEFTTNQVLEVFLFQIIQHTCHNLDEGRKLGGSRKK